MSISNVIDKLLQISNTSTESILNRNDIVKFVNEVRNVLFLGYDEKIVVDVSMYLEVKLIQIVVDLSVLLKTLNYTEDEIKTLTNSFIDSIPNIKSKLNGDLTAFLKSDPAVKSEQEVILCYPGFYAIVLHRIANELMNLGITTLPRIIAEHAHSKTGIDIHPGASIGNNFFIDHGTGVVIGETSIIGNDVKIYQGVTLGAISLNNVAELKNVKRHPTIENNVVIYSNTSILGGETIIKENSVIGCNLFITKTVEKNSKIVFNDINQMKVK